jgi:outer membrane protein
MNKTSVVLFGVVFLAIASLFVLQFTNIGSPESAGPDAEQSTAAGVAFVDIDSVIFNFDMFADKRNDLLEKQKQAEAELNSKGSLYERNARDFQDKVNKGLVTRATAAEMEQNLLQQQQELINLRDNLQSNLMEEEQVMNRQIVEYITSYLEENKSDYNFQYILGKTFGSTILYGDPAQDITKRVTEALNTKYTAEKK